MTLKVIFWDVQHGSATFVRTPNGKTLVIDLGTGSIGGNNHIFSPLLHLKRNNINLIDQVIITHPHTDHIDDIFNFYEVQPRVLLRPNHLTCEEIQQGNPERDQAKINKYIEIDRSFNAPLIESQNIMLAPNNGGVSIQYFTPQNCSRSNLNNHSIVCVLEYCGYKIVIPGDNQSEAWRELLEQPRFVNAIRNADVLVASHHGRMSGYCSDIFEHFTPKLTIVSDGPATETSAVQNYSRVSTGFNVRSRSGGSQTRFCLTTRQDGVIVLEIGNNIMNVSIK